MLVTTTAFHTLIMVTDILNPAVEDGESRQLAKSVVARSDGVVVWLTVPYSTVADKDP